MFDSNGKYIQFFEKHKVYKSFLTLTESTPNDFYELLRFNSTDSDYELLDAFLDYIKINTGKAPSGMSKEWKILKFIADRYYMSKNEELPLPRDWSVAEAFFTRDLDKNKLDRLLQIGQKKKVITTQIKGKHADYINESNMAESRFKQSVNEIEHVLNSLSGFHEKAMKRNLTVRFIRKDKMKSKASYKQSQDEIRVRGDYNPKNDNEYGSVPYLIVHELGHRYLKKIGVDFNHDSVEWITTPYSKVDSMTGEEKFAELFALSHFKYSRFSQYKPTIDKFVNRIKESKSTKRELPPHLQSLLNR